MSRSKLENTCKRIRANTIEQAWLKKAQARLDSLTKPLGSLGALEQLAVSFVAACQEETPSVRNPAVYVFAADHGIASEGVSAYPAKVTAQMVRNFLAGGAAVNVLARLHQVDVVVIDVGVNADFDSLPGLIHNKVRFGTRNFLFEPAMTEQEMFSAVDIGSTQAGEARSHHRNLVIAGEMGIGNTTAAAAITSALTGAAPATVTGAGTGLSSEAVIHKTSVIERALEKHLAYCNPDPLTVLRCLGGLEIAAMAGLILGSAAGRTIVVLDGFISTAAAALAATLEPAVKPFLLAGHKSKEPGHATLLTYLGLQPILALDMRLGEGTGGVLATSVLRSALTLYTEMATFDSARISGAST